MVKVTVVSVSYLSVFKRNIYLPAGRLMNTCSGEDCQGDHFSEKPGFHSVGRGVRVDIVGRKNQPAFGGNGPGNQPFHGGKILAALFEEKGVQSIQVGGAFIRNLPPCPAGVPPFSLPATYWVRPACCWKCPAGAFCSRAIWGGPMT